MRSSNLALLARAAGTTAPPSAARSSSIDQVPTAREKAREHFVVEQRKVREFKLWTDSPNNQAIGMLSNPSIQLVEQNGFHICFSDLARYRDILLQANESDELYNLAEQLLSHAKLIYDVNGISMEQKKTELVKHFARYDYYHWPRLKAHVEKRGAFDDASDAYYEKMHTRAVKTYEAMVIGKYSFSSFYDARMHWRQK